jgi:FlaA1/EpsC-like NDP-sugar epimerase
MRAPVNRHRLWQAGVDAVLVAAAWVLSWYVRFDSDWPRYYDRYLDWDVVVLVVAITLPVFFAFGFYNRWWRYVSTSDMWGALRGVVSAIIAVFLVFTLLDFHPAKVPRGIWIIDLLILWLSSWASGCWRGRSSSGPLPEPSSPAAKRS